MRVSPELLFITCGRDPHCEGLSPSKHFLLNHRQYTMIPPILTNIPCWVSPDKRNNSTRDCHNTQRATSVPTEPGHCVLSMIQQIYVWRERDGHSAGVSSLQRQRARSLYVVTVLGGIAAFIWERSHYC